MQINYIDEKESVD